MAPRNKVKLILGCFLCCMAFIIVWFSNSRFYLWSAFFLWIFSVFGLSFDLVLESIKSLKLKLQQTNIFVLLFVGILPVITRLLLLDIYPFNSIGDELRDGGTVARDLMNLPTQFEPIQLFGYGPFDGFGLISPTLLIPFTWFFANDTMSFKLGAALFGIIDIWLVFFLVLHLFKKTSVAFVAFLYLLGESHHLYYSRTEFLVVSSSLFTTCSIIVFLKTWQSITDTNRLFSACMILGFFMGFQPSIRVVAITMLVLLNLKVFYSRAAGFMNCIAISCINLFGTGLGLGPRLFFSNKATFFQLTKVSEHIFEIGRLSNAYLDSLLVYFWKPSNFHFFEAVPFTYDIFRILFLTGFFLGILNNRMRIILFFILVLPFTNSAIVYQQLNSDHRLTVLLPFISIVIAYPISLYTKNIFYSKTVQVALVTIISAFSFNNTFHFFWSEVANYSMFWDTRAKNYQNFMATYVGQIIKESGFKEGEFVIIGNRNEIESKKGAVLDYLKFILGFSSISFQIDETQADRLLIIESLNNLEAHNKSFVFCNPYKKFKCPLDKQEMVIKIR